MNYRRPKLTHPLVGKGKGPSLPFQVSVVCWIDLLGYGSTIAEARFNPLHPKAGEAISRLRQFHQTVAKHSGRNFPSLVMNDGAAVYRDLSLRTRSVTHDFLVRTWKLFRDINAQEVAQKFPGARAVLATGFRVRGRRAGMDQSSGQFRSLIERYHAGLVATDEALREAAAIRPRFDIVPQLQANFAFTKAYLADQSGAAGGLKGPNLFVDLSLFGDSVPAWLQVAETVDWSYPRLAMQGTFVRILDLPNWTHAEGGPIGILDGLQVAQRLANDEDVLKALRAARNVRDGAPVPRPKSS